MSSNHHGWQPHLTNKSAHAKIKVTAGNRQLGENSKPTRETTQSRVFCLCNKIKRLSSQEKTHVFRGIIGNMNAVLMQTKEWQALQNDLKETSFYEEGKGFQYLAILKHTPVGNYLYVPYGPVYENRERFNDALKSLQELARKHNAIFIRVEPRDPDFKEYAPKNAKKSKDLNPKETWILDLTQDKDQILTNFSQGTRTRYNTYAKKGLSVESTREIEKIKELVRLQDKLFKTKNLNTFSQDYFEKELSRPFASLYLVKYTRPENVETDPSLPKDGEIIAASLFFDHGDTRYYMQSAADTDYKKLPATVALLTKALFDAKEKGIKNFDFWGIAPDGAPKSHPWYGFTEFKKSFGGSPLHFAGTYDIVLNPAKYRFYQLTRKINRLRRRI